MEEVKLEGVLESKQYGKVGVRVRIVNGASVALFSNPNLGRALFKAEKAVGNVNISWDERNSWLIEKYPGMTQQQIVTKLMTELKLKPK